MKNLFFLEAKCESAKRVFYPRYDLAADDKWVLTYGVENLTSGHIASCSIEIDISNARIGPQYKCPYCGNTAFVKCGKCGNITCLKGDAKNFKCAYCGNSGKITGYIERIKMISGAGQ